MDGWILILVPRSFSVRLRSMHIRIWLILHESGLVKTPMNFTAIEWNHQEVPWILLVSQRDFTQYWVKSPDETLVGFYGRFYLVLSKISCWNPTHWPMKCISVPRRWCGWFLSCSVVLVRFISISLWYELSGKHLSTCHHLHLGIAQIAFTPPPALKRALWGTFFRADLSNFVKSPFWGYISATKNPGKP